MSKLPDNLPQLLRKHGLKVVEVPGWRTRGRPASTGDFAPVGVLCHHTATPASSKLAAVLRLLIAGRSDLAGPLCQLSLGRDGTVYIIAAGRANHAGEAKASGSVSAGDGNKLYIGIEAQNDGLGEAWSVQQYEAYVLLCAVLCVEVTKNSANTVRGHKETSVTGKVDPRFDMQKFRSKVAHKIVELNHPGTAKDDLTRGPRVDHALDDLHVAVDKTDNEDRAKKLQAAIAALKLIKPTTPN